MLLNPNVGPTGQSARGPFSEFWLSLWAIAVAFAWVLPNHYPPWGAFHADAWIGLCFLVIAFAVLARSPSLYRWHDIPLLTAAVLMVPAVQYWCGQLSYAGQAWVASLYILGFLLVMQTGAQWSTNGSWQAIDGLFLAIGIAGVISVGMTLYQWLRLSGLDLWISITPTSRMFANMMQPNQLGTLLLWALIACGWGVCRGAIRLSVATFLSAYLIFGIALTQSRTAIVGGAMLVIGVWVWRKHWPARSIPTIVSLLAVLGVLTVFLIQLLSDTLLLDHVFINPVDKTRTEYARPVAYGLFADAAIRKPFWGYGWGQLMHAQLEVALDHPSLGGFYLHSHNLFLDLVLWCGIPIGLAISATLIFWFVNQLVRVKDKEAALLVMFVAVVGWHAMLELPLHYAYMLLPTGLVVGVLNQQTNARTFLRTGRLFVASLLTVAAVGLALIARDYLRVEANLQALRFERAKIGTQAPLEAPEVVLLTHLREQLVWGRYTVKVGMNESEIDGLKRIASILPSPANLYDLAAALAINGRPVEASELVRKFPKILNEDMYRLMMRLWKSQSMTQPLMTKVTWPE